jgi:segregation and condensation protein B
MDGVIEALLYVCGDEGLTLEELSNIIEKPIDECKNMVLSLKEKYINEDRGLTINYLGNSFKLTTKEEYSSYFKKLVESPRNNTLSDQALETLAIIAYNQPITRMQIEEIRGVNSSHVVRKVLMRDLICEKGRSELPGRPILYGTTDFFLDYFGINSLEQLPHIELPDSDDDETNLFESKYKEN